MLKQVYYYCIVFVVLVVVGVVLLAPQKVSVLKGSISVDVRLGSNDHPPTPSFKTPLTRDGLPTQPNASTLPIRKLHLFNNEVVKSANEILSSSWVAELKKMLDKSGKLVSVIFVNSAYLESALNWLIAAKVRLQPPLTDVIVFCLDRTIFNVLDRKGIPSLYIDLKTVVNHKVDQHGRIWMTRVVVYRLVNYFGHDVMGYDSDAIPLRNPQKLLKVHQYSDIITSAGKFPFTLSRVWGFTACMGVILFRSTPRTELLWESMSSDIYDDQMLLNTAFNNCHIQWQSEGRKIARQSIDGQCAGNGSRVTVLPFSEICRYGCNKPVNQEMYIWHQGSPKRGSNKRIAATEGNVWFLRRNAWINIYHKSNTKGTEWLSSLSEPF